MQSILQFDSQRIIHFTICDIRWNGKLQHANISTVFQLSSQMQKVDSSTIDNLWSDKTKVTEVDEMKKKIAAKFLLHYLSSTFTHKRFTCSC